jgi:hypothetical protein
MRSRSDEPEALIESAFDRELKEALDIDPSPEFLARVRTQLASEPEPSAWRFSWLVPAAGVVAIVVAAVVVTSRLNERPISNSADVTLPADRPEAGVAQTFRSAVAEPPRVEREGVRRAGVVRTFRSAGDGSRSAVADSKPLEVIISPDEVRGLKRLIAMVNEEDAGLAALLAEPTTLATIGQPEGEITLPPIKEITLPPIKIDPLIPETDSDTQ